MDSSLLVAALFLMTSVAVIAFALISKKKIEARRDDPSARKSTLAADSPDHR